MSDAAAITACVSHGKSVIYFVDKNQQIRGWSNVQKSDREPAAAGRENYSDVLLKINDDVITSKTKDIAGLSYMLNTSVVRVSTRSTAHHLSRMGTSKGLISLLMSTELQSRIFYTTEDGFLGELMKDEGKDEEKPWAIGKLSSMKYMVQKNTSIAAVMSPWSNTIKVYYYKDGEQKIPWVAWWDGSTGDWKTEPTVAARA